MSQSLARRMMCSACCAAVEAVALEAKNTGAGMLLGAFTGALHEGTKRRTSAPSVVAKALAFGLVGHVFERLLPKAQEFACPNCGCTHLSEIAA